MAGQLKMNAMQGTERARRALGARVLSARAVPGPLKTRLMLGGLVVAGLVLSGCAAKATLHGNVTHERTKGLVTDAKVTVMEGAEKKKAELQTNYAGSYRTELKPGKYGLSLEHARLQPCETNPAEVTLAEGQVMRLDLCMRDR